MRDGEGEAGEGERRGDGPASVNFEMKSAK